METEAVLYILSVLESGEWEWILSEILEREMKAADKERQEAIMRLFRFAPHYIAIDSQTLDLARRLNIKGLRSPDALHLASAEIGGAAVLLTTDDKFLRIARRIASDFQVQVYNPAVWLKEKAVP